MTRRTQKFSFISEALIVIPTALIALFTPIFLKVTYNILGERKNAQKYLVARAFTIPLASSTSFTLSIATAHLIKTDEVKKNGTSSYYLGNAPYLRAQEHHRADTLAHNGLEDSTSPVCPHKAIPSKVTVFQELVPTWAHMCHFQNA